MAWTPSESVLNTLDENVFFSTSIEYVDDLTSVTYPVTITSSETNTGVNILNNNISGSYLDIFPLYIMYRTPEGELPVVNRFSDINISKLHEMVSYRNTGAQTKVFTYTAEAKDGSTVIATNVYTITVNNNFDTGKNKLLDYIRYGKTQDQNTSGELVKWLGLGYVNFANNSSQNVEWRNNG